MAGSQPPPRQVPTLDWSGGYSYAREPEGVVEQVRERSSAARPLALLVAVTLLIGLAVPVAERAREVKLASPDRALDFAQDHLPISEIGARVARFRGIDGAFTPRVSVVPEGELAERLTELVGARGRADREQQAAARAVAREVVLRITGTVPDDFSPGDSGHEAAGVYEPRTNTVVIPFESLAAGGVETEEILAHEFTHALDDQLYGIPKRAFGAASPEAAEAAISLAEGSASFVEHWYARRYLGEEITVPQLLAQRLDSDAPYGAAIEKAFLFRYAAGVRFVADLHRRGGWRLVNRAFQHPPTSMEQVLHPGLWLRGEGFARPAIYQPPQLRKWVRLGFAPFSEVDADVMLSTAFSPALAAEAAEGWAGGRIAVWRDPSAPERCAEPCRTHTVVAIALRWDNSLDMNQFLNATGGYLQERGKRLETALWKVEDGYAATQGNTSGSTALVFAPSRGLALEMARAGATVAGFAARPQQ